MKGHREILRHAATDDRMLGLACTADLWLNVFKEIKYMDVLVSPSRPAPQTVQEMLREQAVFGIRLDVGHLRVKRGSHDDPASTRSQAFEVLAGCSDLDPRDLDGFLHADPGRVAAIEDDRRLPRLDMLQCVGHLLAGDRRRG